ncbi:hypothetical protein HP467_07335 [Curtobacterium albidum]|uniref:Uncharacterized protein n=1 Tax=Curtobacterium citreum TaxID=2036 RepID=A0A850DWU9_9MICO|nr:hypothetical protein [Curtobacterium albidum]NUU27923.1 hypothetical protein [Curtobacterium albidum]
MDDPCTPSTEHVRAVYAAQHGAILTDEHGREFDRWLEQHDREQRAAASEAIESLRNTLALSSRDWNTYGDVAWLWGVLLGWEDDDEDYLPGVAAQWRWSEAQVARLRRLRAALVPYRLIG